MKRGISIIQAIWMGRSTVSLSRRMGAVIIRAYKKDRVLRINVRHIEHVP